MSSREPDPLLRPERIESRHRPDTPGAAPHFVPAGPPQQGDIVVAPDHECPGYFHVRQWPTLPQLRSRSRDEAVRLAYPFAKSRTLDVWLEEGSSFRRLASYRGRDGRATD
jgi:hypothetical protein